MVVAVDEDLRLRQIVGEDLLEDGAQGRILLFVERDAEVAGDVPVGEEVEFARE